MRYVFMLAAALLAGVAAACTPAHKSARGFHLPDGDPARGRQVLLEMQCVACHSVHGESGLPAPVADPPVPVKLGGVVFRPRTDGDLTTSIVDPSHYIRPGYDAAQVSSGRLSRMGDFNQEMTVRQLVDLVAYLQTRYEVQEPPAAQ